nr:RNA-directed DNA polymerase, eukaryota, reverse transcriptase zinc-binding domain protein [Tanacetum cinerariifolium]
MNPFFPMNQNNNDEERHSTAFEIDEETDVYFYEQAYAYHEQLQQEENRPRLTRNPIHPCANNDINVLDNSSLFDELLDDKSPVAPYVVNGVGFENGYYLADGIYPRWATFVKSFTVANDAKHDYFKKRQESARKDVERAFGVLQGRWGIIQQPARQYHVNNIRRIIDSCIIMHNMILEDQKMTVFDCGDVYANPSRNMQRTWIERVVWEYGTDKSPGPDGFSFGFYRQFWLSIENDVFTAVSHFFTFGDIPNGCNSCFIALIPKVPDANLVKDFRPISLIGSMYKIIAKILANRLVCVLGDIVNEVQSAFIMERQILDGPFILN